MKILGIGVDSIENSRIKKSIKKQKFVSRIFTLDEISKSKKINNKISFFSKRFAAKEAFSKALGTGFRNHLNFKDISITNDKYGKPSIKISNKLQNIFKKQFKTKKVNIYLSISDEKKHSIAFVFLGKK
jgi:holo-[acyl-carrier protein] synthase